MKLWISCCLLLQVIDTGQVTPPGNLKYLYSTIDPIIQQKEAEGVVKRILKKRHSEIIIRVDPQMADFPYQDAFSVGFESDKIIISGSTGVAAIYGMNDYLKYHCKCLVTWEGSQLRLPNPLPKIYYKMIIVDRFRYYQNVCTDSYSFVWWNWKDWEKQIDWMALNGINMPLAFTGQEAIWQKVYLNLGLSPQDVSEYISGPAFLAWWRMGNIQKWGGPLPQSFLQRKLDLLHQILKRMRNLGMIPVLPAFAGNVPISLRKIFPNITLIQHPSWNQFNVSYATYMLEPIDPLFKEIGTRFLNELINEVGTNSIYSCDTYNENTPRENTTAFLKASSQSTYQAMQSADPKAVWLMQSWVFHSKFWQSPQVEAYLNGIEVGNALILDLEAERTPLYNRFKHFFGHSFIWCMLQNFGGTMENYGAFNLVNNGISHVRGNVTPPSQFLGIGSCPEGINQNSVMFDFLHEMSLHSSKVDLTNWVRSYAERRYGVKNDLLEEAWEILLNGVYNAPVEIDNHGRSLITRRPSLKATYSIWYKQEDIRDVLSRLINSLVTNTTRGLENATLYQHDLVDFTRQYLQILGSQVAKAMIKSFKSKKLNNFERNSHNLIEILDDMEFILKTNKNFLLGKWIKDAESFSTDEEEIKLLRNNALNQITLWGPTGEIVDYASKQWAGTVGKYYKPRWMNFIQALNLSLLSGKPFSSKRFRKNVFLQVELPFTFSQQVFPVKSEGNSIIQAKRIFKRWNKTYEKFVYKGKLKAAPINQ